MLAQQCALTVRACNCLLHRRTDNNAFVKALPKLGLPSAAALLALNQSTLQALLLYHMLPGVYNSSQLLAASDGMLLVPTSLEGAAPLRVLQDATRSGGRPRRTPRVEFEVRCTAQRGVAESAQYCAAQQVQLVQSSAQRPPACAQQPASSGAAHALHRALVPCRATQGANNKADVVRSNVPVANGTVVVHVVDDVLVPAVVPYVPKSARPGSDGGGAGAEDGVAGAGDNE